MIFSDGLSIHDLERMIESERRSIRDYEEKLSYPWNRDDEEPYSRNLRNSLQSHQRRLAELRFELTLKHAEAAAHNALSAKQSKNAKVRRKPRRSPRLESKIKKYWLEYEAKGRPESQRAGLILDKLKNNDRIELKIRNIRKIIQDLGLRNKNGALAG